MFDNNNSSVRLPELLPRNIARHEPDYLFCIARPGEPVSPVVLPLLSLTFWADPAAPRDRIRYREAVNAAAQLHKPQAPWETRTERRKVARRWVRDALALPGSPLVRTRDEWEVARHA